MTSSSLQTGSSSFWNQLTQGRKNVDQTHLFLDESKQDHQIPKMCCKLVAVMSIHARSTLRLLIYEDFGNCKQQPRGHTSTEVLGILVGSPWRHGSPT